MESLREIMLKHVYSALVKNNWKRDRTARDLEISVRGLRNYIRELRKNGYNIPDSPYHIKKVIDDFSCKIFPTNEERLRYLDNPHLVVKHI